MSVDFSGITEMRKRMEALADDMPKIMEQLVIGEGVYAVGQARRICKEDGIVNNGTRSVDLSLCCHLCGADPEYRRRRRPHRGDLGMRGIYGVAVFYPVQNGQPCKIHLRLPLRDFGPC